MTGKIGIFFGTDSGTTRLIAKKIAKQLGPELVDKPININRVSVDDLLAYDALILGTPTYGDGVVPGIETGVKDGSWQEFLPSLVSHDFSGKTIAVYGLGDQEKYGHRFASGLFQLYSAFKELGANMIGEWTTEGYEFEESASVVDGKFVGLVLDQGFQGLLTEPRITEWLEQIKPALIEKAGASQAA